MEVIFFKRTYYSQNFDLLQIEASKKSLLYSEFLNSYLAILSSVMTEVDAFFSCGRCLEPLSSPAVTNLDGNRATAAVVVKVLDFQTVGCEVMNQEGFKRVIDGAVAIYMYVLLMVS